jgi:hypothetical protein
LEGAVGIGEVNNCLLECFRAVHDLNLRLKRLCVNYIITVVSR